MKTYITCKGSHKYARILVTAKTELEQGRKKCKFEPGTGQKQEKKVQRHGKRARKKKQAATFKDQGK